MLLDGAALEDCVALVAALGVTLGELVPLPDRDRLGDVVELGVRVGEGVGRRLGVAVCEALAVDDPDGLGVGIALRLCVCDALTAALGVSVNVAEDG